MSFSLVDEESLDDSTDEVIEVVLSLDESTDDVVNEESDDELLLSLDMVESVLILISQLERMINKPKNRI